MLTANVCLPCLLVPQSVQFIWWSRRVRRFVMDGRRDSAPPTEDHRSSAAAHVDRQLDARLPCRLKLQCRGLELCIFNNSEAYNHLREVAEKQKQGSTGDDGAPARRSSQGLSPWV